MIGLQFVLLVSWWFSCSCGFQPRGQKLLQTRNRLHSIFNPFGKFASNVKPEKADSDTWRNGYANTNEEVCDVLVGTVPGDLVGTYYRNVHGKYQIGRDEIAHPFDADGMVTAITFQNGTCFFRNRFIPGGWLANFMRTKLKNVANTNVIYFANKLLALWEAGGPYALDADTLHTVGKFRFNGALQDDEPFTAHPKIDPFSGHLVGFNYQPGPRKTDLRIMEFASNMSLLHDRTIEIPGFSFFHDMAITRKHALFVQGSFDFNPLPFVLGFKSPAACMTFNKKGKSKLHIVSRTSSARRIVELDSHFNFHVANAFERANGDIVIDVVGASDMLMMKQNAAREPLWRSLQWNELPLASLQRYVVHTDNSFEKTPLFPHPFEMPVVPASLVGQDVRFVYGISTRGELKKPGPFQSLVKIDTTNGRYDQYDLPTDEFLGEPAFAPKMRPKGKYHAKGPEDDGYLLVMTLNGRTKTSALLVFDAQNIRQGPIQRFALPTFVSYGLHGSFVPNLTFPYANVLQKFSAFSALDGHV